MKNLVIYHASCPDGFTAAWAAHLFLKEDAEYRPYQYDWRVPEDAGDFDNIYILDFSFKKDKLIDLASKVRERVIMIDHHKTALEDLGDLLNSPEMPSKLTVFFDMKKSGARLAWDHFHGSPPPLLVQYIQDRDLWSWELPRSREVSTYLETREFTFEEWDGLCAAMSSPENVEAIANEGQAMQAYRDALIKRICERPGFIRLEGHLVPCVNAPQWQSDIGNVLAKQHPFAVMWFMNKKGEFIYSLRSDKDRPNEAQDVSKIAEIYGGGGHKNAAGFRSFAPPMMVKPPSQEG